MVVSVSQASIRVRIVGVELNCLGEQCDRALECLLCLFRTEQDLAPAQEKIMRLDVSRWYMGDARRLGRGQRNPEGFDDAVRHLVLQRKDIGHVAVVAVRPDMGPGPCIDQLGIDPDAVAGAADRALEHRSHAEFAPDRPDIDVLAFVGEAGVAGDDREAGDLRQVGYDVFAHAVGEVVLLGVAAHIGERQDGDRVLCRR